VTAIDDSMLDLGEAQAPEPAASGGPAAPAVVEAPARVAPSRWVREATFREKLRGYAQADVDAFLDQVAFAFDDLEARLRDAQERARRAAGEAAVTVVDDETVRRTLTLAQRTAELAIAEAERQAAELVERARAEADALVREAEAESNAIRERERSKLQAELTHLESARAVAAEDLDTLEFRRKEEHDRLTRILADLADLVEQRLT
jgi:DivIVA domain-containing protein